MWRVGPRKLPTDLVIHIFLLAIPCSSLCESNVRSDFRQAMEGGSDWFALHRSFAEYLMAVPDLMLELRRYYDFSLLSAESYFHVVLANSPMCQTFYPDNHRMANWRRELGCRCQVIDSN